VFYLTYVAVSHHGAATALASTTDFRTFERHGIIFCPENKDVVLFPERIAGDYVALHRPHAGTPFTAPEMWLARSPDLIHWGDSQLLIKPVEYHWDEMKIGPGATPIRTPEGWLNIYHGAFPTMDGCIYRLGVALHDLTDPAEVLGVCDRWILQPEDPWEGTGYVHNVVFTCAAVPEDDGTLKLYWGGADKVMCAGTAVIDELVDFCLQNPRPPM